MTYIGWKSIKKYYLIHLFPKKILVPRPQKWGPKMGHFWNLFSKCVKKCHKMVIFKDNFSIFHVTKLCSKNFVIYANKNFKLFIPYQTQKLKNHILIFPEKKSNVGMYIFLHILKVKLKCYILLGCAIKTKSILNKNFDIQHFQIWYI